MITDRQACFQLKASFSPCTILQILHYDLDALTKQLAEAIARAPQFFMGSPVVIDLEKAKELGVMDFTRLKSILVTAGLAPVGAKAGTPEQMTAAATAGLPMVNIGKGAVPEKKSAEKKKTESRMLPAKIIHSQVRSGMQVYAKETDLIVLGQVSAGAELLSDGNIHIYGALRGRALAGVQGNTQARIFCRTLEAELVSIAGYYLTKEDMQKMPVEGGMIQIYLDKEQVKIEPI